MYKLLVYLIINVFVKYKEPSGKSKERVTRDTVLITALQGLNGLKD